MLCSIKSRLAADILTILARFGRHNAERGETRGLDRRGPESYKIVQSDRKMPQWIEESDHAFTEKEKAHVEGRRMHVHPSQYGFRHQGSDPVEIRKLGE
jgi:hypothetical protein